MNILLADDHTLFRDTLNHYIHRAQPAYNLETVSNVDEMHAVLKKGDSGLDLCLLDFKMPSINGYEGFCKLLDAYPHHAFAVITEVANPDDINKIMSLNVAGYIPKTLSGRLMLKAIDTILMGRKYIPYQMEKASGLSDYFVKASIGNENRRFDSDVHLTRRELEVLELLCEGRSNKAIAAELGLKVVTIKLHIRGIFRKLECDNRTMAALTAKELGIITSPSAFIPPH